MIVKYNFDLFKKNVTFLFRVAAKREEIMQGWGNRCADGMYVLFLDYDKTPIDWIQEEIRLLQKNYSVGTPYLFRTKNGIHVVFLEKFTIGEIIGMMNMTTCDKHYKEIPLYYGRKIWVLRHSDKKNEGIQYLGCGENPNRDMTYPQERSRAHKLFLRQRFGIPEKDFKAGGEFDSYKELTMAFYRVPEAQL